MWDYLTSKHQARLYQPQSVQPSLEDVMNRNIKWSPESPQQIECERRLLMLNWNWMFDDLQPYTVVENSQFQGFVASLNIKFDVPNSTGKSSVLCNNQCLQFLEEPSFALLYMM